MKDKAWPRPDHRTIFWVSLALLAYEFSLFAGFDTEWRPLAGPIGLFILLGGVGVALGFTLGSWWAILATCLAIPAGMLTDSGGDPTYAAALAVFFMAMYSLPIATGVGLRKIVVRLTAGRGLASSLRYVGAALMAAIVLISAYSEARTRLPIDVSPSHPRLIDERAGSFRGVRLRSRESALSTHFGRACTNADNDAPCGKDAGFITGPQSIPSWGWTTFHDVTAYSDGMWVQGLLITDGSGETTKGVGIGDSLLVAKRRYRGLRCTVEYFHDGDTGNPYCTKLLPGHIWLFFGGNPIDSVVISTHRVG